MTSKHTIKTLHQALKKFRIEHAHYLSHTGKNISPEQMAFYNAHDVAHVLFGCDVSLYGEGKVKLWTIFGTTLGFWNHIMAYRQVGALQLSKRYGVGDVLRNIFPLLLAIPIIIIRAKQMKKCWPWSDYERYMDMSLDDIRREYNIVV